MKKKLALARLAEIGKLVLEEIEEPGGGEWGRGWDQGWTSALEAVAEILNGEYDQ